MTGLPNKVKITPTCRSSLQGLVVLGHLSCVLAKSESGCRPDGREATLLSWDAAYGSISTGQAFGSGDPTPHQTESEG